MSVVECGRGHLYDTDMHTTCPYCNNNAQTINFSGIPIDQENRTRPISSANNPVVSGNNNVSMPKVLNYEVSVLDEGKTLPPKNYSKPKKVEEENKTVGIMKDKLGIDPVVGWLVCISGKEMGKDYRIKGQINVIGRSDKMDICIKDDPTISFENHARLSYSERNNTFYLLPADNRNVIYLNDNEVFTPTVINSNDIIDFGETKLMFIPLCNDKFTWQASKAGDK